MSGYRTILIDPPWCNELSGRYNTSRNNRPLSLTYNTMSMDELRDLPVADLADTQSHLWLWTINQMMGEAYGLVNHWGFRYLQTITWVKPSGLGNWFVSRTQHLIFAYRGKLDMRVRYQPNIIHAGVPRRHSRKPEESYRLIELVSYEPRLELFARYTRPGWSTWGDQVPEC